MQEIIDKYRPLIYKNIYKFYVKTQDQEDFYQEAILLLLHAIEVFKPEVGKTFTKFYEMILFRRFIILKDKTPKYVLIDQVELIEDTYMPEFDNLAEDIEFGAFEKEVYKLKYIEHLTDETIAENLAKDLKSVRNAIHRIKIKVKEQNENILK
ncbi:sigma-70 family RNA polymerase sigma factor [Acholeplasma equirhinis]|uniref:sigma-70 family RNA polymerase sigma factor n=1 Tax=Acholeplasma equirhinis TaxID=555393 RepID=UPI00197AA881|nr:sigma-70 family RNA polymerase sigma factor [Acholeplasma equirhinis]MBN3490897.1 sigma-70 family RNA polymerase sigma factor [Acholeplasma equirhinis]